MFGAIVAPVRIRMSFDTFDDFTTENHLMKVLISNKDKTKVWNERNHISESQNLEVILSNFRIIL